MATEIIIETDGGTVVVPHDATSVRAARNVIVSPAVLGTQDVQAALEALAEGGSGPGGSGDGAPVGAQYVVMAASPTLTNERVLTAGSGITITDAATDGGAVTIAAAVTTVAGRTGAVVVGAADIADFGTAAAAAAPVTSVAGKTGVVTLAKADVGLGNVDNTSDTSKPISTATQTALDGKAAATHTHGALNNDGTIGSVSGLPVVTGASGAIGTLALGASGQVLKVNANATGVEWGPDLVGSTGGGDVATDLLWDAKGDLAVGTADNQAARLAVGANGTALVANSTTGTGLEWKQLAAGDVGLGNVANAAQVTAVTGTAPIVSSGGTTPAISISAATTSAAGSMSSADKTKLNGIETGAQVNAVTTVAGRTGAVVLAWGDIASGVPSTFAPSAHKSTHATGGSDALTSSDIGAAAASHTHGNISSAGAIGTTSGLPIKTGGSGVLEAGAFGTSAGQFAEGNHTHTASAITDFAAAVEAELIANLPTDSNGALDIAQESTLQAALLALDDKADDDHTHGSLNNDGTIGTTAGLPVVTGTGGAIGTLSLGSAGHVLRVNSGATGVEFAAVSGGASALGDLTDVTIATPQNGQVLKYNGTAWVNDTDQVGSGGGGAPIDAQYLVLNADAVLSQERVFLAGDGIAGTDAAGNYTLAVDLATNPGLEIDSAKLRAKIKTNGGLIRDSDGLSVSLGTGATDAAAGNHTHDAAAIASGTINADRIPTLAQSKITNLDTDLSGKAAASHTHGNLTNDGKLGTAAGRVAVTTTDGVLTTIQAGANGTVLTANDSVQTGMAFAAPTIPSHTHGNISNAGAIGTTANLPIITTTSGVLTTGAFGTGANQFCQGNDGRLSDARTPSAHTHGLTDSYVGFIEAAADKTYMIDFRAATTRTITDIRVQSTAGTCTAAIKNGANTVGTVSVTSTSGGSSPSLSNTSVSGSDPVSIEISSNSNAVNVSFAITYTAATGAIS